MVSIPQLSYDLVPAVAFAGMLADSGMRDVETAFAEVVLDAGLGVCVGATTGPGIGTGEDGEAGPTVILPTAAADVTNHFKGVALYNTGKEPTGTANRYAVGDPVPCLQNGRVWVQIDATALAALVNDGPVFLVHSGAQAGKFRGDAGVGPAATVVANAKCKIGGVAGGVGMIKLNLP